MLICTECNREYEKGKFCMGCGGPLRESRAGNKCPSCGAGLEGTENFCTECGARLSAETSAAPEITYEELKKLYDEGQYEESYAWAKKLADRGDARGQNLLGIHYKNGKCVEHDKEKAAYWYQKAAEQGHEYAITGGKT